MLNKYFKPKSLSWLSAVVLAAVQVIRGYGVEVPKEVDAFIMAVFMVGMRGAVK